MKSENEIMNNLFVNNIGDLSELQRASFYRFLISGISEELLNFPNPFFAKIKVFGKKKTSCLIYFYPNEIKLKGPNFNLNTCIRRDLTYSIHFFIQSEYSYYLDSKNKIVGQHEFLDFSNLENPTSLIFKKIRVKQDIFFGEIPLMTEEGTFVISGCERIVISQIIRSPGIYFRKEFGLTRKINYTATIISNKGLWTKVFLDTNTDNTSVCFTKDRIYLKLSDFQYKKTLNREEKKIQKKDIEDTNKLFILDLISFFGLNREEISDSLKYPLYLTDQQIGRIFEKNEKDYLAFIKSLFLNQRSGCFSIGEIGRYKINKKLGLNLPKEITYLTAHDFLGIIDGLIELKYYDKMSDDIDHIQNKQIRSVGELLQNQIRIGFYRIKKSLSQKTSFPNSEKLNFDLDSAWEPEDWILDPRPLTNVIKEFFKTSQLSQYMDQINPLAELTHKRRVSVFGPNGLKRDHISTVIRDIHPSQYGRLCPIETSEGQNAGLIMSMALYGRINSLGSIETPYFLFQNDKIFSEKSPIYLNPEQESDIQIAFGDLTITKKGKIEKEYLSVKDNYLFSMMKKQEIQLLTTTTLQVVSLATALIPFLEHDDANRALMGSNMQRQAVPLLYTQKPLVGTGLESAAILDSGLVIKSYCEGKFVFSSSSVVIIQDFLKQKITYFLRKYSRSNQETSINQRPIVWTGEKVFSGQIIADGPSTNDGELSLGRNLLIGYMPWEGYNYEDAIILSERILVENCLTSIHIEECETQITYGVLGSEKLTNNLPYLTSYIQRHLNSDGIVKIGSYIKEHDVLVGKLTPCEEDSSPEAKLLRAIYGKKEPNLQDTSLRVSHGTEGRVIDVRIISMTNLSKEELSFSTSCEIIRIYIAKMRNLQVGDKLAGRHGNKGIISRILSRQDMPYLPDGTPLDILFNPLGVPSRMNVGQIFECLLGLAGEKLGKRYKITPFDEVYGHEASRILVNQKLKEAALKNNLDWLFNTYSPGKIFLRDGRTGEYFDNPITVGKSYILKLIHLVEDKIHARATGPYSMITEQPLAGKSQKGGQRFGEMEVWALEAYGCSNTLQELLTIKSDDIDGRNDMYEALLMQNRIEKPTPSLPESFIALIRELNALGLDFSFKKFSGGFHSTTNIKEMEKDLFFELENRLKLRALLARKKAEHFSETMTLDQKNKKFEFEKNEEKKLLFKKFKTLS